MFDRHPDQAGRTRRRPGRPALERLEGRELMAYTSLGASLPDPAILDAFAGPVAAYGQQLAVTVDVGNLGASTVPEPLALTPGATSTADLGPTTLAVYFSPNAHFPFARRILVGTIDVPPIPQNSAVQVTGTVALPEQTPRGFPALGQTGYITVQVDSTNAVQDFDRTNNILRRGIPVQIATALPDLQAIALNLPAELHPGDAIVPKVKVANYGTVDSATQGEVVVEVVASLDPNFGPGDQVLTTFTVPSIPPLSEAPTARPLLGDVNLFDPNNVVELVADQPVALPTTPGFYYVGVVVDPFDTIQEISEIGRGPDSRLDPVQVVTPGIDGLPPAEVVIPPSSTVFPNPPFDPTVFPNPTTAVSAAVTGQRASALAVPLPAARGNHAAGALRAFLRDAGRATTIDRRGIPRRAVGTAGPARTIRSRESGHSVPGVHALYWGTGPGAEPTPGFGSRSNAPEPVTCPCWSRSSAAPASPMPTRSTPPRGGPSGPSSEGDQVARRRLGPGPHHRRTGRPGPARSTSSPPRARWTCCWPPASRSASP